MCVFQLWGPFPRLRPVVALRGYDGQAFASLPFGFTHGQDGWLRRASSPRGRYPYTCGRDEARPSTTESSPVSIFIFSGYFVRELGRGGVSHEAGS